MSAVTIMSPANSLFLGFGNREPSDGDARTLSVRQREIYNNLLKLTHSNEAFYYVDQFIDNKSYRIFLYRLASYTDFLQPDAMESRGIMFEMDGAVLPQPIRLACRPFKKFFNLGENPMTMNLDLSAGNVLYIADKVDGSLISSYLVYDGDGSINDPTRRVMLKTKGSLHSEQAVAAMKLLDTPEYRMLKFAVQFYTLQEATVNMEYTSPENRIVLGYEKPGLTVLGVVDNVNGSMLPLDVIHRNFPKGTVVPNFVEEAESVGMSKYLGDVKGRSGIEGVVVALMDGTMVKLKADAYVSLHHAKDSINSPRRLFEAVVNEAGDDLRSMFFHDTVVINRLNDMQAFVSKLYNGMVAQVEGFYEANKHLERKDFAIKGQKELDKRFFSLVMMKYTGKAVDYKGFLIKHYKDFGVKDDDVNLE